MLVVVLAVLIAVAVGVEGAHWGLVVAGSSGYMNYRHQADALHAYHVLHGRGVPSSNIVTMVYDDIAGDPSNPFPGQMFNKPTAAGVAGYDVYKDSKRDYVGDTVSVDNFLAVLTGDGSSVRPPGLPVLRSGPEDEVFVYYTDHGGVGLSCFPDGDMLYADELLAALATMHVQNQYKKMVIYWESCESGSMFEHLPDDWNIYVVTAANANESSWGTYCPPSDMVNGTEIGACLGDEYSTHWMENADLQPPSMREPLERQFEITRQQTLRSHVTQYGDLQWTNLPIALFEANQSETKTEPKQRPDLDQTNEKRIVQRLESADELVEKDDVDEEVGAVSWSARETELRHLYWRWRRAPALSLARESAWSALKEEIRHRRWVRELFGALVQALAPGDDRLVERMLHDHPSGSHCSPQCKQTIALLKTECFGGKWSEYALKFAKTIINLDQHQLLSQPSILDTIHSFCH